MADDATPDPSFGAIDAQLIGQQQALSGTEAQLEQATQDRDQYQQQRDFDQQDFNPDAAAGQKPVFNEPTPQDHFNDVMKQAPLLMALGAVGGAFGKQHGITMLASTNAMMKGIVQGSADQYKAAREQYAQQYENFQDKSKTWLDVYKAYSVAYKGRLDADQKAVQAANASVGVYEKEARMTKSQIAQLVALKEQIKLKNAQIERMSHQNVTDKIKADADAAKVPIAQQNADANTTRANATASREARLSAAQGTLDEDTKQTVALGQELLSQLDSGKTGTFGGTGIGGTLSRGKEYIASKVDSNADLSATQLATKADLFTEKMTAALKVKSQRMDAGDRIIIREAIDVIHNKGVSDPIAKTKIEEALRVLQKLSGSATKTIGGKTYVQRDGKWYEQ
jgi:hypothetical protein